MLYQFYLSDLLKSEINTIIDIFTIKNYLKKLQLESS